MRPQLHLFVLTLLCHLPMLPRCRLHDSLQCICVRAIRQPQCRSHKGRRRRLCAVAAAASAAARCVRRCSRVQAGPDGQARPGLITTAVSSLSPTAGATGSSRDGCGGTAPPGAVAAAVWLPGQRRRVVQAERIWLGSSAGSRLLVPSPHHVLQPHGAHSIQTIAHETMMVMMRMSCLLSCIIASPCVRCRCTAP